MIEYPRERPPFHPITPIAVHQAENRILIDIRTDFGEIVWPLCIACGIAKVRDGDTIEVRPRGTTRIWAIRLLDCWCHETRGKEKPLGLMAKNKAIELLGNAAEKADIVFHIPKPCDTIQLLKNISFDRILGYIWLNEHTTLNEAMVKQGFAASTKAGLSVIKLKAGQQDEL